jgi:hypothetical protein
MDDKIMMEWMQEVYREFQNTNDKIDDSKNELKKEISLNREEFVIHKTKVNTRTALISIGIGSVVTIISILMNFGVIGHKHKQEPVNIEPVKLEIEQVKITEYESSNDGHRGQRQL